MKVKYTIHAYGISYSRYYIQDYIPDWLEYYFRITILRFFHKLFGHKWGKWTKFSYVKKGQTGFVTIEEYQTRDCSCYKRQSRSWSKKNQMLLEKMKKVFGKAIQTGHIGHLYGVRFVATKPAKTAY